MNLVKQRCVIFASRSPMHYGAADDMDLAGVADASVDIMDEIDVNTILGFSSDYPQTGNF